MKILPMTAVILLSTLFVSGCAQSAQTDDNIEMNRNTANTKDYSAHFKSHYVDAGQFLNFMHEGDIFLKDGKYDEAITAYNQGLEKHAYSRPEQTRALEGIAKSYEAKGQLQDASKNYELASSVTMNDYRSVVLHAKSQELVQQMIDKGDSPMQALLTKDKKDEYIRNAFKSRTRNEYQQAIEEYAKLKSFGNWYEQYADHEIAECYSSLGQYNEALKYFQKWFDSLGAEWEKNQHKDEYNQYRQKAGLPPI